MKNHVARNGLGYLALVFFGVAVYSRIIIADDPNHAIAWRHLTLAAIFYVGHWTKTELRICTTLVIRAICTATGHEEVKNGRSGS